MDLPYPSLSRASLQWGFFREYSVQVPVVQESLPEMVAVGDQGDYSFVLVDRFELVALNKRLSVFGGRHYRTMSVADPHLVSASFYVFYILYQYFRIRCILCMILCSGWPTCCRSVTTRFRFACLNLICKELLEFYHLFLQKITTLMLNV